MAEPIAATTFASDSRDPHEKSPRQEIHGAGPFHDDEWTPQSSTQHSNASTYGDTDLELAQTEKIEHPALSTIDEKQPELVDPNSVDWNGLDDPEKPTNWPASRKHGIIAIISTITFLTPLASSMFAPGVPQVMAEFNSNNVELASFVVSVYILGYAFGPMVIAPMSELYGRLPVYHVCNSLFVVFTVACAVSSDLNMLIIWRFFAGLFGSCPLTIGGGTIADMISQSQRGRMMAIFAIGPLLGPVIGPVIGGYLSQAKGWRWVFWLIAIVGGAITLMAFIILRETYPPVLLERKAKALHAKTKNAKLKSIFASDLPPRQYFVRAIVRPFKLLFLSPIVLSLSTLMAVVYGYLYLLFTTITEVFEFSYHFSSGAVGLTFLGLGVGSLLGLFIFGAVSDRIVKMKSKDGEMKPEYRLPPMIPGAFLMPIGLFLYGWTAEKHIHWIVPIIGTGFVGVGLLATFLPVTTYLIDAFTLHAASATAASTILRSLVAAFAFQSQLHNEYALLSNACDLSACAQAESIGSKCLATAADSNLQASGDEGRDAKDVGNCIQSSGYCDLVIRCRECLLREKIALSEAQPDPTTFTAYCHLEVDRSPAKAIAGRSERAIHQRGIHLEPITTIPFASPPPALPTPDPPSGPNGSEPPDISGSASDSIVSGDGPYTGFSGAASTVIGASVFDSILSAASTETGLVSAIGGSMTSSAGGMSTPTSVTASTSASAGSGVSAGSTTSSIGAGNSMSSGMATSAGGSTGPTPAAASSPSSEAGRAMDLRYWTRIVLSITVSAYVVGI
ncbi:MAG: hypothetical protein Q9219_005147 [cf. Caloplaca sp. 3 TL-2023]